MTEGVVHRPKSMDVHQRHSTGQYRKPVVHPFIQGPLKTDAIGKAGQRIIIGKVLQGSIAGLDIRHQPIERLHQNASFVWRIVVLQFGGIAAGGTNVLDGLGQFCERPDNAALQWA